MELGNYSSQQQRSPLTMDSSSPLHPSSSSSSSSQQQHHRSSLTNAAFFATAAADDDSAAPSPLLPAASSSPVTSTFTMSGQQHHYSPRPPPTFSPYGVEYSSSTYSASSSFTFTRKWALRFLNICIVALLVAIVIYIVTSKGAAGNDRWGGIPSDGVSLVKLNGCDTTKSSQCKDYKFPEGLLAKDVELVDFESGNYLFRSNLPLTAGNGLFDKNKLLAYMSKAANSLPMSTDKVQIVIFSLLNQSFAPVNGRWNELCELSAEKCWFEETKKVNNFYNYPLLGEDKSPFDFEPKERREKASTFGSWSRDPVGSLTNEVRTKLTTTTASQDISEPHLAILFHCHFGKDRTGLLSAAYRMQYKKYTLAEVWKDNKSFHEDDAAFINGLLWYCFYLEEVHHKVDLKCDSWPDIQKSATTKIAPPTTTATTTTPPQTNTPTVPTEVTSLHESYAHQLPSSLSSATDTPNSSTQPHSTPSTSPTISGNTTNTTASTTTTTTSP
eukprot:GHVS01095679.1.p1 GENE.GHVS01095679.1~~GHVS01095679.1.p1  ORF type:complete len:499 (-),score=91.82 GHVS01095679.1:224-1720(-)